MRRRTAVAHLPLLVGFSGCLGGPNSATDSVTANVTLRSAIRYVMNDDAIGVDPPEGDQFAFVYPPGPGSDLSPDAFGLELGDRRFAPRATIPGFTLHTPGVGEAYTEGDRSGWLVFDVTRVDADDGALVQDGTRTPLPEDSLPSFAAAPDFSLESVSVPDAVSADEFISVTVDVANDGDREGTFLAGIQRDGVFETVEATVRTGTVGTTTPRLAVFADPGETEHFRFVHAGGHESYEVSVEGEQ